MKNQMEYFITNTGNIIADPKEFDTILILDNGSEGTPINYVKIVDSKVVSIEKSEFDSIERIARAGEISPIIKVELNSAEDIFTVRIMGIKGSGMSRTYKLIYSKDKIKRIIIGSRVIR